MSFTVQLAPSGNQYTATEHQTLLDGAIQAGLNLPYGCRTGNCGTCKGLVVSGQIAHGDYQRNALTSDEVAAGKALLCCATALSDCVIQVREAAGDAIKPRILPARVERKEKLSDDVMALFLKLPSSEKLLFKAGQYVEFILKDGKRRAFSIANAPHEDALLEFHLRLVPKGLFTSHVFNDMAEKAILRLEAPLGSFYVREESTKPIIFIAGGTGFAPIKGMITQLLHANSDRKIHLYWAGRVPQDLYLADLPQAWSAQARIAYTPVLSRPLESDAWQGRIGYAHHAVMADYPDLSAYEVYCCGAPAMVEAAQRELCAQGLPEEAFLSDAFSFAKP